MRCVMSKLAASGRITVEQFRVSQQWARLSRAYRAVVSGSYDDGGRDVAGDGYAPSRDRLSSFERAVIKRYRRLAPIMGAVEREIIEGRGRYPRSLDELCGVRKALDEIGAQWVG